MGIPTSFRSDRQHSRLRCLSCLVADYFPEEDRNKASEAMQLFKEANRMLDLLDKDYEVRTIFKLCKANSDGDNLVIEKKPINS